MNSLGANLIKSAADFETAAALLISAEAEYLNEVIQSGASICELMQAQKLVCSVIENLKSLEQEIVHKVDKGIDLLPEPMPPCHEQSCCICKSANKGCSHFGVHTRHVCRTLQLNSFNRLISSQDDQESSVLIWNCRL